MSEEEYEQYMGQIFDLEMEKLFQEFEALRDVDGGSVDGCYRTLPKPSDQ